MEDDLEVMRSSAAAAAATRASISQDLEPARTLASELTANDTSDSDTEEGGEGKKYLRPPAAPQHVRIGQEYQAALPAMEEDTNEGSDEGEESNAQRPEAAQLRDGAEGSTSSPSSSVSSATNASSRAASMIAGRMNFDQDGLDSGTRACQ
ncbi:hypothetical protein NSK_003442 [Nannochloropsis salina CCMP1776]|uniref:Uncharacterized protein n=1 Tax=Nannochloropsis salina CCMP1776 TaxID=1027361 RepID=A0A4D9D8P1_9STRA|nr:hypothetical protein NSK_003442 [Nannochloropsis salina CCMP1776]|eukprot:TFJ85018.1 hypothetical protein NSK_003442 [Nannochloropsis salina CCMP1776]